MSHDDDPDFLDLAVCAEILKKPFSEWEEDDPELVAVEIFDKNRPNRGRLVRAVQRSVFGVSDGESEDCVQEFAGARFRNVVSRFDPVRGPFLAWFWVIFRNHTISWGQRLARRKQREVPSPMDEAPVSKEGPVDPVTATLVKNALTAYSENQRNDLKSKLAILINKLPADVQTIFIDLAKGHTRAQIAERLGISEDAVTKRIQRARDTDEWQEIGREFYRYQH